MLAPFPGHKGGENWPGIIIEKSLITGQWTLYKIGHSQTMKLCAATELGRPAFSVFNVGIVNPMCSVVFWVLLGLNHA